MGQDAWPLLSRPPDSQFALVSRPMPALDGHTGTVDTATFAAHVAAAARVLPDAAHFINICENRYLFSVSLMAVALSGRTSLMPPNANPATQAQLAERYPHSAILHDGVETAAGVPAIDCVSLPLAGAAPVSDIPVIAGNHVVAISFTSGSTGRSQPNPKTWGMLVAGADTNARYYLGDHGQIASILATVPGQHMWGLESSVTMPLRRPVLVSDGRPLYPLDVQQALAALPAPRILVTTPFHLRALIRSGLAFPPVSRVLCATAPLDPGLAQQAEDLFGGELVEIYGCSEMGSMAWRRTTRDGDWSLFDGMAVRASGDGFIGSAAYIPEDRELQDLFEFTGPGRFRLSGRRADLLDIAGKRGSLAELNAVLMDCPGVADGAVFQPPQSRAVPRLAALVVLESGASLDEVIGHFRRQLDPVFVPRPVIAVERLNREANGKITRAAILSQYDAARST